MQDITSLPALIGAELAARHIFSISERKFHELRDKPGFPAPVAVPGLHARRWRTADLLAYVASLSTVPAAAPEPAQLQKARFTRRAPR